MTMWNMILVLISKSSHRDRITNPPTSHLGKRPTKTLIILESFTEALEPVDFLATRNCEFKSTKRNRTSISQRQHNEYSKSRCQCVLRSPASRTATSRHRRYPIDDDGCRGCALSHVPRQNRTFVATERLQRHRPIPSPSPASPDKQPTLAPHTCRTLTRPTMWLEKQPKEANINFLRA